VNEQVANLCQQRLAGSKPVYGFPWSIIQLAPDYPAFIGLISMVERFHFVLFSERKNAM